MIQISPTTCGTSTVYKHFPGSLRKNIYGFLFNVRLLWLIPAWLFFCTLHFSGTYSFYACYSTLLDLHLVAPNPMNRHWYTTSTDRSRRLVVHMLDFQTLCMHARMPACMAGFYCLIQNWTIGFFSLSRVATEVTAGGSDEFEEVELHSQKTFVHFPSGATAYRGLKSHPFSSSPFVLPFLLILPPSMLHPPGLWWKAVHLSLTVTSILVPTISRFFSDLKARYSLSFPSSYPTSGTILPEAETLPPPGAILRCLEWICSISKFCPVFLLTLRAMMWVSRVRTISPWP